MASKPQLPERKRVRTCSTDRQANRNAVPPILEPRRPLLWRQVLPAWRVFERVHYEMPLLQRASSVTLQTWSVVVCNPSNTRARARAHAHAHAHEHEHEHAHAHAHEHAQNLYAIRVIGSAVPGCERVLRIQGLQELPFHLCEHVWVRQPKHLGHAFVFACACLHGAVCVRTRASRVCACVREGPLGKAWYARVSVPQAPYETSPCRRTRQWAAA